MDENISYQHMESLLRKLDCYYTPAEVQGVACGLIAVNMHDADKCWLGYLIEERDTQNVLQNDIAHELQRYIQSLQEQMMDSHLQLELLLPEESEMLEDRVDALQEWAQGFMTGAAMAGLTDFEAMPEDSRELLYDFIEISKASQLSIDDREESEDAYIHITEYLRMGVLLIAEELQPACSTATIH